MTDVPEVGDKTPAPPQPRPGDDEVAELRAEIARLKEERAQVNDTEVVTLPPGARTGWWRTLVAATCITIAALLAPLSVLAIWAHDQVGDTDRYLQTVTPLASDPAVQNAIIDRVTNEIVTRIDVPSVTNQVIDGLSQKGLPPAAAASLSALSGPISDGITNFVHDQVAKLVRSPQFEDAWVEANRSAHKQLVTLLTGKDSATVKVNGNSVQLNLAVLIDTVKQTLVDKGFALAGKIPEVNAEFTIMQSADLSKGQRAFRLLSALSRWLPIIGLLLIALAVYVAKGRRRTLMASGLAVAGGMLLLGLTLNLLRPVYLDAIPSDQLPQNAAGVIYDQVVSFIRFSLRAVLVVSLAVAVGAWLAGPSRTALGTRRGISEGSDAIRRLGEHFGVDTGAFGEFLYRYRTVARGLVIGVALLVYVAADHPTGSWTLKLLLVTVLVLGLLEILARPPRADTSTETPAPPPGAPA